MPDDELNEFGVEVEPGDDFLKKGKISKSSGGDDFDDDLAVADEPAGDPDILNIDDLADAEEAEEEDAGFEDEYSD